jgi:hypothetical protein
MLAEKLADRILGKAPLPLANVVKDTAAGC